MTAAQYIRAYQTRSRGDQIGVVPRRPPVRQERDVFQPSTDTVTSVEGASIDCPAWEAIPVVNLLQRDARGHDNVFHLGRVTHRNVSIGIERLDEDAATPAGQSGTHERSRIVSAQQSRLDTNASGQQ